MKEYTFWVYTGANGTLPFHAEGENLLLAYQSVPEIAEHLNNVVQVEGAAQEEWFEVLEWYENQLK